MLVEDAILEGIRRNFDFSLETSGAITALMQTVKIPKRELNALALGGSTSDEDVHVPGKEKKGEITIKAATPLEGNERFWDDKYQLAKSGVPGTYRFPVIIHLHNSTGGIRESYDCGLCWVRSIEIDELKKKESENEVLYKNLVLVPQYCKRIR